MSPFKFESRNFMLSTLVFLSILPAAARAEIPLSCLTPAIAKGGGGAGGGNGGDTDEIAFIKRLIKTSWFVASPAGRKVFPEVEPNELSTVASNVRVYMKDVNSPDEAVKDTQGRPRTCAWDEVECSITCDRAKYSEAAKDPAIAFVQAFHEALGLMNLERGPDSVPSQYPISSRLIPYVKQVIDYDLVADQRRRLTFLDEGYHCSERSYSESTLGWKKSKLVTVSPHGSVNLWGVSEPLQWNYYFEQVCADPETGRECPDFVRNKVLMKLFGLVPKAKLLASGKVDRNQSEIYYTDMKSVRNASTYRINFGLNLKEVASSEADLNRQVVGVLTRGNKETTLRCSTDFDAVISTFSHTKSANEENTPYPEWENHPANPDRK